jgi:hypothetical protein
MDTRAGLPIAGVLTGTAWAALWLWEQSPYGLDHPQMDWIDVARRSADLRR